MMILLILNNHKYCQFDLNDFKNRNKKNSLFDECVLCVEFEIGWIDGLDRWRMGGGMGGYVVYTC